MRDIKFRGKSIDSDEWVEGYYVYDTRLKNNAILCEFKNQQCYVEVSKETIGQYTGLKDKNEKEIYEGDIFHLGDKNIKYVVVWNDTGLQGKQLKSRSYVGLQYWKDKIEVIGSIHEN